MSAGEPQMLRHADAPTRRPATRRYSDTVRPTSIAAPPQPLSTWPTVGVPTELTPAAPIVVDTAPPVVRALRERERLATLLASGGDSRVVLQPSGENAYYCPPLPCHGQIVRGSCTGSPPTETGVEAALGALRGLDAARARSDTHYAAAFDEAMEGVRARLGAALHLPADAGLVLMPSGTDAEFIPLAIAQQLYPGAPVRSVLAAHGETGSGGLAACAATYFDALVPLAEGEPREAGRLLDGFPPVEVRAIGARDANGAVVDAAAALPALQWEAPPAGVPEPVWVLRSVLGAKTGFSTVRLGVAAVGSSRVLEVLDLCQMRRPLGDFEAMARGGALLLLTGSKFFQGSAFSSAVVIPPSIMHRLEAAGADGSAPPLPAGLCDFLSGYEVPRALPSWREQLGRRANEGLLLRWHTALPLVEAVSTLPAARRAALEAGWMVRVSRLVAAAPGLELVHVELGIVSVALRKAGPHGARCTKDELKWVHRQMAADASALWCGDRRQRPAAEAAQRMFIGQPVGITPEYAVLRIALGAELLLELDHGQHDPTADEAVVSKLCWLLCVLNRRRARLALRTADAICFDVDATVIREEGINRLACAVGCGEEVAAMTRATMEGGVPFHEALRSRLDIIQPSVRDVERLTAAQRPHTELLTPRVAELIGQLHAAGRPVYLISGGFHQLIKPFADTLGVGPKHVFANRLLFDECGEYKGVDPHELMSQPSGKAKVIEKLKATHGYRSVVMVGDGANDMEARDCAEHCGADVFIGFGGVKLREVVRDGADWFVTDFGSLIEELH